MRRFWRSQRGSQVIQFAAIIPIVVFLLYGSFEVWKVLRARDALQEGVFQAVLFFSSYGYEEADSGPGTLLSDAWEAAREIVVQNLQGTGVIPTSALNGLVFNIVYNPGELDCNDLFQAEASLPWEVVFAPLAREMALVERQEGQYQCRPPKLSVDILSPSDGWRGAPDRVDLVVHCTLPPRWARVEVTSNGSTHASWQATTPCGQRYTVPFPLVPSGPWSVCVQAKGKRTGLLSTVTCVRGEAP